MRQPVTSRGPGPIVMLVGAAVLAAGSVLPWAKVSAPFAVERSIGGLEGDGVLTVVGAVLIAAAALLWMTGRRWGRVVGVVVAVLAAGIAIYDLININDAIDDIAIQTGGLAEAAAGIGIYVAVAGAIVALIGGVLSGPVSTAPDRASGVTSTAGATRPPSTTAAPPLPPSPGNVPPPPPPPPS
ncbi:MAG: Trp biosynthesis-associated membrane protein [Actinomycetota bacterium]